MTRISEMPGEQRVLFFENQILRSHIRNLEFRMRRTLDLLEQIIRLTRGYSNAKWEDINFDIFEIPACPSIRKERVK